MREFTIRALAMVLYEIQNVTPFSEYVTRFL